MDIHFLLWGIIQYYVILLFKLFQLWPMEALPYFLSLKDVPGSFGVFPGLVLESAISPKSPAPFIREWC